jgi:import inner membrane translocase subunit TIM9
VRRVLPAPLLLIQRALLLCSTSLLRTRRSLKMYNGLVERCFMSCVDTFRRKTLEKNEEVVRVPPHCTSACCAA